MNLAHDILIGRLIALRGAALTLGATGGLGAGYRHSVRRGRLGISECQSLELALAAA